jgi:hypothetical protein
VHPVPSWEILNAVNGDVHSMSGRIRDQHFTARRRNLLQRMWKRTILARSKGSLQCMQTWFVHKREHTTRGHWRNALHRVRAWAVLSQANTGVSALPSRLEDGHIRSGGGI